MRGSVSFFMLCLLVTVAAALSSCASATDSIGDALKVRYHRSLIEINDPRTEGRIVSPGTVLVLQAAGIPAKKFRVVQANSKSPRFHFRDYTRVDVGPDGQITVERGDFTLERGARLIVLNVKVENNRVRLFTHTRGPVGLVDRMAAYGCTEFVFHFKPSALESGDVAIVQGQIESVVALATAN